MMNVPVNLSSSQEQVNERVSIEKRATKKSSKTHTYTEAHTGTAFTLASKRYLQ